MWYWLTVWLSLQGVIGVSGAWRMQILYGLCGWCSARIYCRLCQPSWPVFFQLASHPPPCPLSLFPLLVGVMGEGRRTSVGANSWVLGSMPTMGVLPALGAYWRACFRWNRYDILGTQPSFPYGIYSYLFKLSNEWLRLMEKTTRSKNQFI